MDRSRNTSVLPVRKIDLIFPVTGNTIPLDHGYALYSALSRIDTSETTWIHESDSVGVHLIPGRYAGPNLLALTTGSRLRLRLPESLIPQALGLSGREILLNGSRLYVGPGQSIQLKPASTLYARIVSVRNGHDEARFEREIRHQLGTLSIAGRFVRGKRRVFAIKGKTIVGHSLLVTELTATESILLQEHGLGGRRKMGCGLFMPWSG